MAGSERHWQELILGAGRQSAVSGFAATGMGIPFSEVTSRKSI